LQPERRRPQLQQCVGTSCRRGRSFHKAEMLQMRSRRRAGGPACGIIPRGARIRTEEIMSQARERRRQIRPRVLHIQEDEARADLESSRCCVRHSCRHADLRLGMIPADWWG
jgi:hypothetical protein